MFLHSLLRKLYRFKVGKFFGALCTWMGEASTAGDGRPIEKKTSLIH